MEPVASDKGAHLCRTFIRYQSIFEPRWQSLPGGDIIPGAF
jgi:hypothetical protein